MEALVSDNGVAPWALAAELAIEAERLRKLYEQALRAAEDAGRVARSGSA